MFDKIVCIDGKGHLLGHLAAAVAKEILSGQLMVVIRCECIEVTGTVQRNVRKFKYFEEKRTNTNPKKGPLHHRSPDKIFRRTVRGMVPYKTHRGGRALKRLVTVCGIPEQYGMLPRANFPRALRYLSLKQGSPYCELGNVAKLVGWKYAHTLRLLEDQRKKTRTKAVRAQQIRRQDLARIFQSLKQQPCIQEDLALLEGFKLPFTAVQI